MDACGCDEFASIFDEGNAEGDRERYRRKGPDRTTSMLLDAVRRRGIAGADVLDIGGGIGVIDLELLRSGAGHATLIDVSEASLRVARDEANRANVLDRMEIAQGDFVRLAPTIARADIVTLDRVVCCYGDPDSLVGLAADRTNRLLGLVLPRDHQATRAVLWLQNLWFRLRRNAYRAYAHPNRRIDELASAAGLRPVIDTGTWIWRVVLYERAGSAG